jgi:hypothetical protein
MRKLIFAITKQCDERIDEKAYRLESLIYLTSFVVSLLSIAALIFSILANSTRLVMIFAVPALISMSIVSLSMFDVSQLEERAMLEELSYEKLSESSARKILYDRKIDESREVYLSLNLIKSDRQYSADRTYGLQYVADNITYALEDAPESEEFAYLYYRFSNKIVYHSHAPIYVNRISIDSIEKIDVTNRFAKVKIDRIEEFDAEVKLSFEGREKIKNVKMIDVFFEVINAEDSEKKQLVYDELVERSK